MNPTRGISRAGAAIFFSLSFCYAGPVYYLATDQTGAQTQIDAAHTSKWTFVPNMQFDLGGGIFEMKDGSSTVADIRFSLYLGNDATGTLLDSITLSHTSFCAQTVNCGSFGRHDFLFATAVALTVGQTYYAELTSIANDVQSQAYFIKSDSSFVSDSNRNAINPQPVDQLNSSSVPEPATGLLTLLGIAGAVVAARLRRGDTHNTTTIG